MVEVPPDAGAAALGGIKLRGEAFLASRGSGQLAVEQELPPGLWDEQVSLIVEAALDLAGSSARH